MAGKWNGGGNLANDNLRHKRKVKGK